MARNRTCSRLAAAYHEAGHAVASWRLGDGIGRVTIVPSVDLVTGARNGGSFTLRPGGDRSFASDWGFRHLVMLLAGPVAQRRLDAGSFVLSCAASDLKSARDFTFVMCRSPASERALLAWALSEARALIATDWLLVGALAQALMSALTLNGDRATAILVQSDAENSARTEPADAI